eukprot:GFUD01010442.1.p1 GENE.GFUD01010442.1~~GFUD01010442.1.p1  ORF type:complete len:486 (+),score=62.98 GFUD01010442.1:259-1716(+)
MKWSNVGVLGLLTLSYMVGEVAHFLIAVTSKDLANSVGFGDMKCYTNMTHVEGTAVCSGFKLKEDCAGQSGCVWMYSGQGWEYQILAGPAFIVVFTISGVLMGFLADRISRPRLLSASVFVFSISLILMGFSTKYWQLVVLRMGIAAGEAALRPAGGSLIAEMFSAEQRGVANGIFSWGVYFGYGFSFLFGIYLTQLNVLGYGWRATYVIAGLPGILIAAALLVIDDPRTVKEQTKMPTKVTAQVTTQIRKLSYGCLEQQSEVTADLPAQTQSYLGMVRTAFTQPAMLLLFLAAAVRHTGGYSWAHNNVSYFSHYHEGKEIGYWFMICAIAGGSVGVFIGGYISDLVVTRLGLYSRLWLLGACTMVATPFAVLTLHLDPPHAFGTLLLYYFFAETWFSLLFTVLVEIVPSSIRSVCIGSFLFLMNNVGGNLPMLIDPLTKLDGIGLQTALYITWPGLIAASGVLFFVASIPLWKAEHKERRKIQT